MKVTFAVFAFLYSSKVSAIKMRDIFDAYDDEALIEANNQDDQIDPAQLTAEIGGDDIAREVQGATAGVGQDTTMLQLDSDVQYPKQIVIKPHKRRIIDADGDGVEDNVQKDQYELDRFRVPVFSVPVQDMHNTHNGEMPGHIRFGDSPEPGHDPWEEARNKENAAAEKKAAAAKAKAKEIAQLKADLAGSDKFENIQLLQVDSEFNARVKHVERKIIDADGDGVEDNRAIARHMLDRFDEELFGEGLDDMHNTHNGELPGHESYGEDPAPDGSWVATPETKNQKFFLQLSDSIGDKLEESNNLGDSEFIQTNVQFKPREKHVARKMIDEDGDGVEDNRAVARHMLDRFYEELFGDGVDDIMNTHNGELPGHERYGEDPAPDGSIWQTPETQGQKFLVQLDNQELLWNMSEEMTSPDSLTLLQFKPWKITDADGDGVEDNVHKDQYQLDKFREPVFGVPVEDLNNTHHGNLPGHVQREFDLKQSAPVDSYTITKRNWNRFGNL